MIGRIVFGLAAILFGAIQLMWHDAQTWQQLHVLFNLPSGTVIAEIFAAAQIVGGAALLFSPSARLGSIVLAIVYSIFCLASVSIILKHPRTFDAYDGFFEQFALLCAALAVYSAKLRTIARLGFGLSLVSFTLAQAIYPRETASLVPTWIPPNQMFWAILTTVAFGLAALAVLINYRAQLALQLTFIMLALFGVLVWIPLLVAKPHAEFSWSEFALTFLIAGAAGTLASATAELRPRPAR